MGMNQYQSALDHSEGAGYKCMSCGETHFIAFSSTPREIIYVDCDNCDRSETKHTQIPLQNVEEEAVEWEIRSAVMEKLLSSSLTEEKMSEILSNIAEDADTTGLIS